MSAEHLPALPDDALSPPIDLDSVFAHPAGLRLARGLVRQLAIQREHLYRSQLAEPPRSIFGDAHSKPAPSPPISDSSPEVADLLKEILAFSVEEAQTSKATEVSAAGEQQETEPAEGSQAPPTRPVALPTIKPRHTQQESSPNQTAPRTQTLLRTLANSTQNPLGEPSHSSADPLQQLPTLPSSSVDVDIDFSFPTAISNTHGTASPYRIESPSPQEVPIDFVQPAARHSARMDQQSNARSGMGSGASQSQTPSYSMTSAPSTQPASMRTMASFIDLTQDRPSNTERPSQFYAPLRPTSQKPNSVKRLQPKGFLPVNRLSDERALPFNTSKAHLSPPKSLDAMTSMFDSRSTSSTAFQSNSTSSSSSTVASSVLPSIEEDQTMTDVEGTYEEAADMPERERKIRKKRKAKDDGDENQDDGESKNKRPRKEKRERKKKGTESKKSEPKAIKEGWPNDIWMRIFEFTPPSFLRKARCLNSNFKDMIDSFVSIYTNQRKENYGPDMPDTPFGLTERQYNDLLGGKGCMNPGCDDALVSRTHWTWAKRWCVKCWNKMTERDDKLLKTHQNKYGRATLVKMFEAIPSGMVDSFGKPHDQIEDLESRPRVAPRIYRCYLLQDIENMIQEFEALTPTPHKDDPTKTPEENARSQAEYNEAMAKITETQDAFFLAKKEQTEKHMDIVRRIECAIRRRREELAKPYEANRQARRDLFLRRAREDIPHVLEDFIKETKAFKDATRIFRDPGSERGWKTLRPKIEKEWELRSVMGEKSTVDALGISGNTGFEAFNTQGSAASSRQPTEEVSEDEIFASMQSMDMDSTSGLYGNATSQMSSHQYFNQAANQRQRHHHLQQMAASQQMMFSQQHNSMGELPTQYLMKAMAARAPMGVNPGANFSSNSSSSNNPMRFYQQNQAIGFMSNIPSSSNSMRNGLSMPRPTSMPHLSQFPNQNQNASMNNASLGSNYQQQPQNTVFNGFEYSQLAAPKAVRRQENLLNFFSQPTSPQPSSTSKIPVSSLLIGPNSNHSNADPNLFNPFQ